MASLLILLLGMVRRGSTLGEALTNHPLRKKLLDLIRWRRGLNMRKIERETGFTRSAVRHHLRLLEDSQVVKAVPLGRERHYFPREAQEKEANALAHARHGQAWRILREVLLHPGIRQHDLIQKLGMDPTVLRRHLKTLIKGQVVTKYAYGRVRKYYPGFAIDPNVWQIINRDETMNLNLLPGWIERRLWELEPEFQETIRRTK